MARVLIIDDEPEMRLLIAATLKRAGHAVVEAAEGKVGLELARKEHPNLVICDVGLTDITGYEVLKALRAGGETANTPVILITGMADLHGMREGMRLGADDYLPKPFSVADLTNIVANRLRKTLELQRDAEEKVRKLRSHISMMLPQGLLNPLTGIIGLSDILREEAETLKPAEMAELGRDIQRSGERLHRLIRNFLIYSQIELLAADTARVEALRRSASAPLQKILTETAERIADTHNRRQDLRIDAPPVEVRVSEPNLAKLVEELVDNACKFSPAGRPVRVSVSVADGKARLRIDDEGPGIPPDIISSLHTAGQFERFFYEQRTNGLGLAIAIRLVELHNGTLAAETRTGGGTSLVVDLPVAAV